MNKKLKIILYVVLGVIVFVCAVMLISNMNSDKDSDEAYDEAASIALSQPAVSEEKPDKYLEMGEPTVAWVPAEIEEDKYMKKLEDINLEDLQEKNADVVGWIQIPGTKINYPIVQGEDNEYYLEHNWKKKEQRAGAIFLECKNDKSFTDWNTIIYGHNMSNGSMFGSLKKYKNENYFEKHPYVYVVIDGGVLRYEIFSVYTASVNSQTFGLSYNQQETRENFLRIATINSVIDTGIVPELNDQIITLSTCSGINYNTRYVIHARLPMVQTVL